MPLPLKKKKYLSPGGMKSYRGYAKSYKACKLGCANYGIGLLVVPRLKQMIAWGYSKSSKGKRWYADEKG